MIKKLLVVVAMLSVPVYAGWDQVSDKDGIKSSVGDKKIVRIADTVVFWQRISKDDGYSLLRLLANCGSLEYSVMFR